MPYQSTSLQCECSLLTTVGRACALNLAEIKVCAARETVHRNSHRLKNAQTLCRSARTKPRNSSQGASLAQLNRKVVPRTSKSAYLASRHSRREPWCEPSPVRPCIERFKLPLQMSESDQAAQKYYRHSKSCYLRIQLLTSVRPTGPSSIVRREI